MIWDRWRRLARPGPEPPPLRPFEDLLEEAPVMAILVDARLQVVAANQAARQFFDLDPQQLPVSLVEATREASLVEVLRAGKPEGEARLVHHGKVVASRLVPGPQAGETLMFLADVTELRRLGTVRQEFVANLTHELKTPLTSLRLAVESLHGDPPAAARRTFAAQALRETDYLGSILDNLRQLAELESGQVASKRSSFGIRDLIDEILERMGYERPVNVDVADGLQVEADRSKLAQVLANLLDNAARFSPAGSAVDISAAVHGKELVLRVRDRGPGLAPEHWDRVFERFYKVDPARPRETAGSGLGLSITRHLMLAQGGRIWTEAAEGGGQVFALGFPLNKA